MRATCSASWSTPPGRRQAHVADVEVEVEVRVVDPVRVVEAASAPRRRAGASVRARRPSTRTGVHRRVRIEVGARSLVDRQPVDVAERRRRLHVQEAAVQTCELLHPRPPCARCDVSPRSVAETEGTRDAGDGRPCETRRPTMSDIDAPPRPRPAGCRPSTLELVRANVPLVYVDAVPVRVDGLGG